MAKPTKIIQISVSPNAGDPDNVYGLDQGGGLYVWDFMLCAWSDLTDLTADATLLRHQAAKHQTVP